MTCKTGHALNGILSVFRADQATSAVSLQDIDNIMMATSIYSRYLSIGLTLMIVFQAILNISVVIGLFPITGIPLTFISFGGTSLVLSLFFCGVILNIHKTGGSRGSITKKIEMDKKI